LATRHGGADNATTGTAGALEPPDEGMTNPEPNPLELLLADRPATTNQCRGHYT
jgi:hypothetical protein